MHDLPGVAGPSPVQSEAAPSARPAEQRADGDAVPEGVRLQLAPAQVRLGRIEGWIVTAVLSVAILATLVVGWALDWFPAWLDVTLAGTWVALTGFLAWLSERWPHWEYRRTAYRLGPLGIDIWKGVVWRSVVSVPRSRVQHTDVMQGPLQRRFGLATLSIHTAGTEQAQVDLEGLEHGTALCLRDDLIRGGEADGV